MHSFIQISAQYINITHASSKKLWPTELPSSMKHTLDTEWN